VPDATSDLRSRAFRYSCELFDFCRGVSTACSLERHIVLQLFRSGSSVGANLEEAKSAHSRRDFAAKNAIALRECRESLYWLRLLEAKGVGQERERQRLLRESDELVAILTTIVRRLRT
jgi:four helix bundle protein